MTKSKQMLDNVQKPGRYIGGEVNSVRKSFSLERTSVALSYPDTYEIGMSYLGLRLLYHLLNEREDIVCERVFAPWLDMEDELKRTGEKLFSLESKTALNKFDIVGFSLSYELTYTNVLNMLHLGGITVKSAERGEDEPLVIAGGSCSYNPEPMAEFIDVFLIGDGEDALPEFVTLFQEAKKKSNDRKGLLLALSGIKGVYIPSLYEAEYFEGKFKGLMPLSEGVPKTIERAFVSSLEEAYYPVKQIVPYVKIVHDRMAVEIMRGCPHNCRFCQASTINRPVRIRSVDRVREICQETYKHTGYERVTLLSLSSVNYPKLGELVKGLVDDFSEDGVGISIPSLKIDEAFYDLPEMIAAVRKTGLTFAPESPSDELRKALGKNIDLSVLCKSATLAYQHGWRKLKLYFMTGFPGEGKDEADKIIELARELSQLKKTVSNGAAEVKLSVNPFVPKPHTPLQWLGMKPKEDLHAIRVNLTSRATKKIKVDFGDIRQSILEACLSRGDRRISNVIYSAWKKGAKMDSWGDSLDFQVWESAFLENGIDPGDYAERNYGIDDVLPWEHISAGVSKEVFKKEFTASGFSSKQ